MSNNEQVSPTYNIFQQAFALSMTVNALFSYSQTPPSDYTPGMSSDLTKLLTTYATDTLNNTANQSLIGEWTLVWGPFVWSETDAVADNSVLIAYNSASSTYVLAIAGTGASSSYDKLVEDIEMAQVGWPSLTKPTSPTAQFIDLGTATGLQNLLSLKDSNGDDIATFLKNNASSSDTLILTGHSLGGALVQALSLYLFTQDINDVQNATSDWANVYVLPTAPPTPGGSGFNTEFSTTFPADPTSGSGFYKWNVPIWNTIDVVPHAWTVKSASNDGALPYMQQIPTLYGNKPALPLVAAAVGVMILKVQFDKYPYCMNSSNASFAGTAPGTPPADWDAFYAEALTQHIEAYVSSFGIADFAVSKPDSQTGTRIRLLPGFVEPATAPA